MNDLISRDAAMDVIKTWGRQISENARMTLMLRDMQALEPVDAVPVQRGVWYKGPDSVIECSECHWFGKIEGYEYVYNFCPHCGADLREV